MNHKIINLISVVTGSRTSWWNLLMPIVMVLLILGGCTTVHINSKPSGADVMASYNRGAFGWTQWGRECQTPCTFTTSNTVQLRVHWADGTLSEIHQGNYHSFGATYDFNFDKSATTPVISMKNDTNTNTGKIAQAQQPSMPTTVAQTTSNTGEKTRDGRFIAYDNGTVLDTKTNLMWAAKDNGSAINWSNAKSYCENYRGGGYTDWRMPTLDELAGLYDASKSRPTACKDLFFSYTIHVATELIDITCFAIEASETRGSDSAYFNFHNGQRLWVLQWSGGYRHSRVLPVRSGKAYASTDSNLSRETTMSTGNSTITGKVEKTTPTIHRTSEGPYCKISVVADNGENYTFFVFGTTSVTDSAGKDMTEGGSKLAGMLLKGERIEVRYSTITNGSIITNGQNGATSIRRVPLDYVQQPTVAQTTSKTTEELQTFTGEVKIIEVKHFTQSEGLGLSQEFVNSFYDGLREHLAKRNVAGQIVDEGSAVPDAVAANTLIVEGKFTEYKKGGFLEGVGIVGSEIKFYRKSDHALIKIITPRVAFKPTPLNSDNGVGKVTGYKTADEIKTALK
jgi:hypothetical protein